MTLNDAQYERFQALLIALVGLDYAPNKRDLLLQRLSERAAAVGCTDLEAYYQLLTSADGSRRDPERQHLYQALTINETCFFRNQEHFAALREVALPELVTIRAAERRLRAWSAGCSTGEEAYSLAIALRESLPTLTQTTAWRTEVYASDLDEAALARARHGHYGKRAMREVAADIRARYFTTDPPAADDPRTFIIKQEIQQAVNFEPFNLAAFPYDTRKVGNCDIIFCENVLIYFAPAAIRQAVDNLYRCLRPGGYLFLGYAETLWQIPHHFQLVNLANTFCYRRPLHEEAPGSRPPTMVRFGSGTLRLPSSPPPEAPRATPLRRQTSPLPPTSLRSKRPTGPLVTPPPVTPSAVEQERSAPAWCVEAAKLIAEGRYDDATSAYQAALRQNPQQVEAICGLARVHANRGLHDLAISECLRAIAVDALYAEAHILMGVIYAQQEGAAAKVKAIEALRKAIYIDMASVPAHFHLAELYRNISMDNAQNRREQHSARNTALHEYEISSKLLKKMPGGGEIEGLPAETLMRVCELNIAALRTR